MCEEIKDTNKKDYHFRPRPNPLGVTWTQLAELTLDTSFDASTEEMLMHRAFQEINKTLDYQAIQVIKCLLDLYLMIPIFDDKDGEKKE